LNNAMADMVKFTMRVEQQHVTQEMQRTTVAAQELRIQVLERRVEPLVEMKLAERIPMIEQQIGPLVETRRGLIVLASAVAVTILLAVVGLVIRQ